MPRLSRSAWFRPICRAVCAIAVASALSGCIVAPYPGYGRPHYWYRY